MTPRSSLANLVVALETSRTVSGHPDGVVDSAWALSVRIRPLRRPRAYPVKVAEQVQTTARGGSH